MDRYQEIADDFDLEHSPTCLIGIRDGCTCQRVFEYERLAQAIRDEVQRVETEMAQRCSDLIQAERESSQTRLGGAVQRERERCLGWVDVLLRMCDPGNDEHNMMTLYGHIHSGAEPPEGER